MFARKKRRVGKAKKQPLIPQTGEAITAHEKAYLDQLEQMIATPGRVPYVRRSAPKPKAEELSSVEPVFDSGPLTANQITAYRSGESTARGPSGRSHVSLVTEDGHIRVGADGVYEITLDVPAADLGQYEEDHPRPLRKTSKPQRPAAAEGRPADRTAESAPDQETAKTKDLFPPGTLVLWDGSQLGIYKGYLEKKGYDLVYVVEKGGVLQPRGICLFAYEPQRLGMLSEGIFRWMEQTMHWDREALVVHFINPEDINRVPVLSRPGPERPSETPSERAAAAKSDGRFVRGRTFTISVGRHKWHAVFWGRNTIGPIVAHHTNRVWSLMHLDLDRFGSSVEFGDVLPSKKILEIEAAVNGQQ